MDSRSRTVKEKYEKDVKIFLFGKHFFSEVPVISEDAVRTGSRFTLGNYCF